MKFLENKNTLIKVLIYVGILVLVCIAGIVVSSWYFQFQPTLPMGLNTILKPIFPQNTEGLTKTPQKANEDTGKIKIIPSLRLVTLKESNQKMYIIKGKFLEKPTYVGKHLTGNFVIADDPNHTPITVIMTIKTGIIYVGRYKGSFEGDSSWKPETTQVLEQLLEKDKPVQLEIYIPVVGQSNTDKETESTFNTILRKEWKFPKDFFVTPMKVGVIVNSE